MNYEQTIRPWLLVCLRSFGVKEVYGYRLPDESTRPQEPYAIYTPVSSYPVQVGIQNLTTAPASDNDVNIRMAQEHETRIRVDYYDSPNGLYEIASCAVAARSQKIRDIFLPECAFKDVELLNDNTTFDSERIDYHHTMVVVFREFVECNIVDVNALIDQIDLNINSNHPTYEITRAGVTPT